MTEPHRIIGIVGWKNSGKTRMVAALVRELTARGRTVSTVKHAHHSFDIDREGADSWQHRQAGAREVAVVSARRWALMHESPPDAPEPPLSAILDRLSPCDIVIVEGYKRDRHDKIEVRRSVAADTDRLAESDDTVVAIVSDDPDNVEEAFPVFGHDAIGEIADFVERHVGLAKPELS